MSKKAIASIRSRVYRALALTLSALCVSWFIFGCSAHNLKRTLTQPQDAAQLDKKSPFLKAHMLDGGVYVLSKWYVSSDERFVRGEGRRLDAARKQLDIGKQSVNIDSVAIFETNRVQTSGAVAAMAVMTGISAAVTVACIADPKACFGSCPTFYTTDGIRERLAAEGFSWCVAPVMEDVDVDDLHFARTVDGEVSLRMTNEALETHVIRHADVLAFSREEGTRVFVQGQRTFWRTGEQVGPVSASDAEGDILPEILTLDGVERLSLADSTNLGARETLEFTFVVPDSGEYGIALGCRQSLLTTFLLYQTLSYMGTSTAEWLATLQRGAELMDIPAPSFMTELGGIEILVQLADGRWMERGWVQEVGPLATDIHLQPIGALPSGSVRVRIRCTQGAWRFDSIRLVKLIETVTPVRVHPERVSDFNLRESKPALEALLDSARTLVTQPGDEYTLHYRLPDQAAEYDLFLESRGYYIEWIRDEWVIEEDEARARQMVFNSQSALRELAPRFKEYEREAEEMFWNSRFAR